MNLDVWKTVNQRNIVYRTYLILCFLEIKKRKPPFFIFFIDYIQICVFFRKSFLLHFSYFLLASSVVFFFSSNSIRYYIPSVPIKHIQNPITLNQFKNQSNFAIISSYPIDGRTIETWCIKLDLRCLSKKRQ